MSANFVSSLSKSSLKIVDNEWYASSGNWDVDVVGRKMTIREGKGEIALQIIADPPEALTVSKVNMMIEGLMVCGNESELLIKYPETGMVLRFEGCFGSHCMVGFAFG